MKLLQLIRLKDVDTLYVLGDVVDRGPENVKLITALAGRWNVRPLMGNHDYIAALMLKTFGMEGEKETSLQGKPEAKEIFEAWLSDGGGTTWAEFRKLSAAEKKIVCRFLEGLPLFAEIKVNGQIFHLSHTVPVREQMREAGRRVAGDFLFGAPEYGKVYFDDKLLVTGHTPTGLIDPAFTGRILRKNNHIAVDCGAVFGNPLGCVCLETGEEYYAQ